MGGCVSSRDCGVYQILNTANGKSYVGRSVAIKRRWDSHRFHLRKGTHKNKHLQSSWNKYGEDSFVFRVLEFVDDEDLLPAREGFHTNRLKATHRDHGYCSVEVDENAQVRFSEEHRRRISASLMGHPVSESNRKAMSEALTGRSQSAEERQRRSEAQKGRKHTEEAKAKIRANGNKGRKFGPLSEEHRRKLSKAHKGHTHSPETRARISKALTGRERSEEHCLKISAALKGRKQSPEVVESRRRALTGKKRPPEASAKAAASNRGRKRTPEQRQRIRDGIRAAKLRKQQQI